MNHTIQLKTYMKSKMHFLTAQKNTRMGAMKIALLRHGVNRFPFDVPELWGEFLKDIPEHFLSQGDTPTPEEWAIYMTLTLFAVHQQGESYSVHMENISLGKAMYVLKAKTPTNQEHIIQRFGMLVKSVTIQELSQSLYTLIKLLKMADIRLDYVQLAEDIYLFQNPQTRKAVQLRWGQDFYYPSGNSKHKRRI